MKVPYVIIGGGIAGTTAAFELRQNTSEPILLISKESIPIYNRILLPHFLKGTLAIDRVMLKKEDDYSDANIDTLNDEVRSVDTDKKTIYTSGGESIEYECLLIAAGGAPKRLNVPGDGFDNVHYFQTINDAKKISKDIPTSSRGVVVGGGFIALEFLSVFIKNKMPATLITRDEILFNNFFDTAADELVVNHLNESGVTVMKETNVEGFGGSKRAEDVKISEGHRVIGDFFGIGVGIDRNLEFLKSSKIKTNVGIVTDEFLRSSADGVYAAGDIAEFYRTEFDDHIILGNWTNAQTQGRLVAQNMLGTKIAYEAISNYSTSTLGINISTFGEADNALADSVVSDGGPRHDYYIKYFIKDEKIIGALAINSPASLAKLSGLVRNRASIKELAI